MESLLRPKRRSLKLRARVLPGGGTYSRSLKVNKRVKKSGVCVHRMDCPDPIQIRELVITSLFEEDPPCLG